MNADLASIRGRLDEIRQRIHMAAARSGRESGAVVLIGVVKTVTPAAVREAVAAGLEDLGENRVQEAERKKPEVNGAARWHLIGHLQRNKAARAVALFDRVHVLDGVPLAEALARHAVAAGRTLKALVQVNATGEESKHGVVPEGLNDLLERASRMEGLLIDGLMSIGPLEGGSDAARRSFARTRDLRDGAERSVGVALPELSMGMSGDFEMAIEEGSTMVRVGTALFGSRG